MNLVTDGLPAIALGVDPGDPDLMERKPRKPNESVFSKDVKVYLSTMPILMTALLLVAFFSHMPWLSEFRLLEARTQLLTAMIAMELVVALSMRSLKYPVLQGWSLQEQMAMDCNPVIVRSAIGYSICARSTSGLLRTHAGTYRLGNCCVVCRYSVCFSRSWQIRNFKKEKHLPQTISVL